MKLILFLFLFMFCIVPVSAADWWDGYDYCKEISINQTMVSQDISDGIFPMFINITDSDLASKAQADGDDIVFLNAVNDTQLDHQIVGTFNSTTGHLQAYINVTDISNVTSINMYYGNAGAINTENSNGVWGANASGIWLMDEGTGLYANDSSSNNNNGTLENGVTRGGSKFGGGLEFDGVDDYVDCGNDDVFNSTNLTVMCWVKFNSRSDYNVLISKRSITTNYPMQWDLCLDEASLAGNDELFWGYYNAGWRYIRTSGANLVNNQWYRVAATREGNVLKVYLNGQQLSTHTDYGSVNPPIGTDPVRVGYSSTAGQLDGSIDFVRIYNRALSVDEIVTSYNNTNSPELFISVGAEQSEAAEDTTPPASITSLINTTGNFWHNWTWTNPSDSDFNHTMIYLNDVFTINVSNTTTFYKYTVSTYNTSTISTHTVDLIGNINMTWVNHTSAIVADPVTYSIGGYVFDSNNSSVYGAVVSDCHSIDLVYTNVSGYYLLNGYSNGSYTISASKSGYFTNSTVAIVSGNASNVNITLFFDDSETGGLLLAETIFLLFFMGSVWFLSDALLPVSGFFYSMWFYSTQIDHSQEYAYFLTAAFFCIWVAFIFIIYRRSSNVWKEKKAAR